MISILNLTLLINAKKKKLILYDYSSPKYIIPHKTKITYKRRLKKKVGGVKNVRFSLIVFVLVNVFVCVGVCERERERERESPFGLRGKEGRVKGSRVELTKNILISGKLNSTLLYFSLPLNPNGEREGERKKEREVM